MRPGKDWIDFGGRYSRSISAPWQSARAEEDMGLELHLDSEREDTGESGSMRSNAPLPAGPCPRSPAQILLISVGMHSTHSPSLSLS